MKRTIFLAAASAALALVTGRESMMGADDGRNKFQNDGGHPSSQTTGGGSFSRPVAPVTAPQHTGGFESTEGRLPSRGTFTPSHAPAFVNESPVTSPATRFSPKTSVPTFVAPGGAAGANVVHPHPNGEGFIRLPGNNGNAIGATTPGGFRDHRAPEVQPGFTASPKLTRGLGNEAAVTGLGAMPSITRHLQQRGQNLQAWSANRELAFNQWHQLNAPRIAAFQKNRDKEWQDLHAHGGDLVRMAREQGANWQAYRQDLWRFRYGRADEIRDRLRDGFDDLFTYDWWRHHHGLNFALGNYSPWWWWNPCAWNTADLFGGYGWSAPIYYDYDANVLVDGDVYIDGQDWGPSATYGEQAMQLANPPAGADEPAPPESADQPAEWQPFGVFALTQQEKGDAVMFFQLAMNRDGLIGGAFTNVLTGDSEPVTGSIDRATQRAAWHVGDKTNTVYESSVANLTLDVSPVLVHFDTQSTQTWLLVRLPSPDLPTAPASANTAPPQ